MQEIPGLIHDRLRRLSPEEYHEWSEEIKDTMHSDVHNLLSKAFHCGAPGLTCMQTHLIYGAPGLGNKDQTGAHQHFMHFSNGKQELATCRALPLYGLRVHSKVHGIVDSMQWRRIGVNNLF